MGRVKDLIISNREEGYGPKAASYPQTIEAWKARLVELESGAWCEADALLIEHWARRPEGE